MSTDHWPGRNEQNFTELLISRGEGGEGDAIDIFSLVHSSAPFSSRPGHIFATRLSCIKPDDLAWRG